jgi:hypothetical protein
MSVTVHRDCLSGKLRPVFNFKFIEKYDVKTIRIIVQQYRSITDICSHKTFYTFNQADSATLTLSACAPPPLLIDCWVPAWHF